MVKAAQLAHPPVKSWALEALEAQRSGNVRRLEAAFAMEGAKIETTTFGGGYGGFRFVTWGTLYGGDRDGETLLSLAVRSDNAQIRRAGT